MELQGLLPRRAHLSQTKEGELATIDEMTESYGKKRKEEVKVVRRMLRLLLQAHSNAPTT